MLRQAFDRSFALAPKTDRAMVESLLAVTVGSHQYVLRLAEVSGLFADRKVTWLPSPVSELMGIAGLRGAVFPVYDLGMLLGYSRAAAPRWLLLTAPTHVGLAFNGFDGYLSVRARDIVPEVFGEAPARHVRGVVQTAGLVRPLLSLASVLESITTRVRPGSEKER